MISPEDFRCQLAEALAGKQGVDQQVSDTSLLQAQAGQQEAAERVTKEVEEERRKNQAVLKLDSQLPIQQYLDILRKQMLWDQNVRKHGPIEGNIAYSLVYGKREGETRGFCETTYYKVVGAIFNYKGILEIRQTTLIEWNRPPFEDSDFNPMFWEPEYLFSILGRNGNLHRGDQHQKHDDIKIFSRKGLQEFTQRLTDFYVGVETGQIK